MIQHFRFFLLFILLLYPASLLEGASPKKDLKKDRRKIQKIQYYLQEIEKTEDQATQLALAKRLIALGPEVIPYIEKRRNKLSSKLYLYLYVFECLSKKNPSPLRSVKKKEDFVARRLEWVKTAMKERKYQHALSLLRALDLLVTRKNKHKEEILQLKIQAEELFIRKNLLRARFFSSQKVYPRGKVLEFKVLLENLSPDKVEIALTVSHIMGQIIIQETHRDLYGNKSSRTLYHTIRFHQNISIKGGDKWEYPFLLDSRSLADRTGELVSYTLQGYLRPRIIKTAKKNYSRYMTINPTLRVLVVERKFLPLAEKPIVCLMKTLQKHKKHTKKIYEKRKKLEDVNKKIFELRLDHQTTAKKNKEIRKKLGILIEDLLKQKDQLSKEIGDLDSLAQKESLEIFYRGSFIETTDQKKRALMEICYTLDDTFGQYQRVLMALLSHLTGQPLHFDKKKWIIWCFKTYQFSEN